MARAFKALSYVAACAALCAFSDAANAAEIKLMASNAVKEAYGVLLPAFEKDSGHKVTVSWGGTADIVKRVSDGAPADIVIITDVGIDSLIKQGKLTASNRINVAKSAVGAAVRSGAPKPDITSSDALKKSLIAAKGIVLTPGPSNPFLHQMFERMGLANEMKVKEVRPESGQQLTDPIVAGKADIAFSQASELISVKGIDFIGILPAGSQIVLTYTAAFHTAAPQPEAAKALVKFLTTPEAVKVLKQNGLEPG
jgi:molybdate transport system substrate-binding protein